MFGTLTLATLALALATLFSLRTLCLGSLLGLTFGFRLGITVGFRLAILLSALALSLLFLVGILLRTSKCKLVSATEYLSAG